MDRAALELPEKKKTDMRYHTEKRKFVDLIRIDRKTIKSHEFSTDFHENRWLFDEKSMLRERSWVTSCASAQRSSRAGSPRSSSTRKNNVCERSLQGGPRQKGPRKARRAGKTLHGVYKMRFDVMVIL